MSLLLINRLTGALDSGVDGDRLQEEDGFIGQRA
jgi:hypothetical protein